ncbi:MAG: NAD-dependent epimerase/dehydratase family protein [Promethearchaeota archaeon]
MTGATGFLGTNVVLELLERGHEVVAFGLPGSTTKYVERPGVEVALGDACERGDVDRAIEGCDAVIHVAGDTSFWKKRFERQRRTNVEGPRVVCEAALAAGVRRVVHTSTVDALGYDPAGGLVDEEWDHFNYAGIGYNYAETKREGERVALSFYDRGLEVVVINPGSMIGPWDHTLQFGRLFLDLKEGKVPGIPPGGAPWAHVAEVAKAHVAALDLGRPGERYITGGVNASYAEVFAEIARTVGAQPPKRVFPRWFMVFYGYCSEFWAHFTKRHPEMNPGMARYMSAFPKYSSAKAERELGFKCLPLEQMVRDAAEWYFEHGFLERPEGAEAHDRPE